MNYVTVRPNSKAIAGTFDSLLDDLFQFPRRARWENSGAFTPKVNVRETDESVELTLELPGMKKDDIKVTLSDNQLTVSGERKLESETKESGFVRREISTGSFSRTFTLPDYIDDEKIDADYRDGLLVVNLGKLEEVKPKEIEVSIS